MPIPNNPLLEMPDANAYNGVNFWPLNALANWLDVDPFSAVWRKHVADRIAAMILADPPENFLSSIAAKVKETPPVFVVDGQVFVSTGVAWRLAAGLPTKNSARFMEYVSVMARVSELRDAGKDEATIESAIEDMLNP